MKKERKKMRVDLYDERLILLRVHGQGIVEWKILQVCKDFIEFEYTLDNVEFSSWEWNEFSGEHIRNYVINPQEKKIWHAIVAYPNIYVDLKHKKPYVFYTHDKIAVSHVWENPCNKQKVRAHEGTFGNIKPKFYQIRSLCFNRMPMRHIHPVAFFPGSEEKHELHELRIVEL